MKKRIILLLALLMVAAVGAQAQSRLEPMTQTQQKLWGEKYFRTWLSRRAIQQMLIFPSFSFPSALYVYYGHGESERLQVKWCEANKDAGPDVPPAPERSEEPKLRLDSIEVKTDKATAVAFSDLIDHAVATCMFNDKRMGLDGTRYFFGNRIRVATAWSPGPGNCKRLTDVLEKAMTAVKNQNEEELKALLPEVEALTEVFKKLYPKD